VQSQSFSFDFVPPPAFFPFSLHRDNSILALFIVSVVLANMWGPAKAPTSAFLTVAWNYYGQVFLFALSAANLDFFVMDSNFIWQGLIVILVGISARWLIISFGLHFIEKRWTDKENMFIGVVFLSKAAVQAALAPEALNFLNAHYRATYIPVGNATFATDPNYVQQKEWVRHERIVKKKEQKKIPISFLFICICFSFFLLGLVTV
jgi:hypothetical protein